VLARAAAPEPGLVRLGPARKPGDSMSSILHGAREGAWEVEAATPATLMAAVAALGDGPLTVKIDIEGGEYALLPPLVAVLPNRATTLLCAFHPRILAAAGVDAGTIAARTDSCLEALGGWSVQLLDDDRPGDALSTVLATRNTTVVCTRGRRDHWTNTGCKIDRASARTSGYARSRSGGRINGASGTRTFGAAWR